MNPIPSTLQPRIGLIACLLIALGCDAGYEGASAAPGAEGGKPQGSSSKSPQTSGSATSEKSPKQEKSVVRVHDAGSQKRAAKRLNLTYDQMRGLVRKHGLAGGP